MSTNFYAVVDAPESAHKQMEQLLSSKRYNELRKILEDSVKEYHIGKRSGGWQFLFSPHKSKDGYGPEMPWENTLQSIKDFLSRPDVHIFSEYDIDTYILPDDFWNKEVGASLYNDPDKFINGKQADEREGHLYRFTESREFTTKEGLRFSDTSEFS